MLPETRIYPAGDAARGEETRGVGEKEEGETGVDCAFGGDIPAESDVVDTAEGEIRLPPE